MSDWYPETDPNGDVTAPSGDAPSVSTSTWYDPTLEDEDYGMRRGFLGDIPCANPVRRSAGILIDAAVSVALPFYFAGYAHLPGGQPLALIALAVLANEGSGYETGQTLGKRLMGLQAVRPVRTRSGKHVIVNRGYVRNLLRALAHVLDLGLWFISIPLMFVNRYHQSLGDLLTRTKVIHPARIDKLVRAPRHAITT